MRQKVFFMFLLLAITADYCAVFAHPPRHNNDEYYIHEISEQTIVIERKGLDGLDDPYFWITMAIVSFCMLVAIEILSTISDIFGSIIKKTTKTPLGLVMTVLVLGLGIGFILIETGIWHFLYVNFIHKGV